MVTPTIVNFGLQKGGDKDDSKEGMMGIDTLWAKTIIQWRQFVMPHCAGFTIKTQEALHQ